MRRTKGKSPLERAIKKRPSNSVWHAIEAQEVLKLLDASEAGLTSDE